jgi:hypothetical protein
MNWFEKLLLRSRVDRDLREEMQGHIDERTEQIMRLEGLSRADARQAALRAFGNPTLVETRSREVWAWSRLEALLTDLKVVARRLSRSPGFAVTVLLTLSIGIGANTAVFSVVDSVLLKPLPYRQSDRLVTLSLQAPGAAGLTSFRDGLLLSPSLFLTFAKHNRTFQSLGVWRAGTANLTGITQPEEVHSIVVSSGMLETLAVPPLAGRWLNADDQKPNGSGNSAGKEVPSDRPSDWIRNRGRLSESCRVGSKWLTPSSTSCGHAHHASIPAIRSWRGSAGMVWGG